MWLSLLYLFFTFLKKGLFVSRSETTNPGKTNCLKVFKFHFTDKETVVRNYSAKPKM